VPRVKGVSFQPAPPLGMDGSHRPETTAERLRAAAVERRELETTIENMVANGLSPQEVAMLTKIAPERLWRRFKNQMLTGEARRKNEVAESAYLMSVGGPEKDWRKADSAMARYWLDRRGGPAWRVPREESEGPDLSRLTVAELLELQKALRPLAKTRIVEGYALEATEESLRERDRTED
jgi:hypothetical protein